MVADSTSLVPAASTASTASTASREVIADLQQAPLRFRQGPRLLAGGPADVAALLDAGRDADIPALVGRVGREPQQAYLLGGRSCDLAGGPAMRHRGGPGNAAGAITAAPQIDRLSAGRPAETPALLRWRRTHHPQSHMQILRLSRHQTPSRQPCYSGQTCIDRAWQRLRLRRPQQRLAHADRAGLPARRATGTQDSLLSAGCPAQISRPSGHAGTTPVPSRHDKRR